MTDGGLGERATAWLGLLGQGLALSIAASVGVLLGVSPLGVAVGAAVGLPSLGVGLLLYRWATPKRWPYALVGGGCSRSRFESR